jgi:large subunit ribosomal protein L4
MLSVAIKDMKGQETGRLELAPAVFEAPIKPIVVREAINRYLANQRQGTAATKTRAEVSGGGRKPWKQKHTGRARQGSIRAIQWRHGGIAFGPQPRSYWTKMPKEKRRVALRSAFAALAKDEHITVLESIELGAKPRTKAVLEMLDTLGVADRKVLIVTDIPNPVLILSARNLPGVKVSVVNNINIYDLLVFDQLILSRAALEKIQETLGS